MSTETCKHSRTAPTAVLLSLHDSQGGSGRHKCTNCAYDLGFQWGLSKTPIPDDRLEYCINSKFAPWSVLAQLPDSQAGSGRHRCPVCAFHKGFEHGSATVVPSERQEPYDNDEAFPVGRLHKRPPPELTPAPTKTTRSFKGRRNVDYESESRQSKRLGNVGESLVAEWERSELIRQGRTDLAQKVEIVAQTQGDGVGYDVKSFTAEGVEKYIEVKATAGPAETPFFLSINELEFSKLHQKKFHLFRVYNYNRLDGSGDFYEVSGNIQEQFKVTPTEFRVSR